MGLTVSIGRDNDELVDNLVKHGSVKTEFVEEIMRLVDRGKFMPEFDRENAYKDSAWKAEDGDPGYLHISAPCIYASVLENLDLKKGHSFLNIGSGTGYLSSMVGFILGENGINHGVELYENIVSFANKRINEFLNSPETCAFEWCVPTYFLANAFQIETQIKYDRIYCGALVPNFRRAYFCSFLKIGGILIMPYGHALQRIIRKSDSEFTTQDISAVTFSHLIPVNPENPITNKPLKSITFESQSLRNLSRNKIRSIMRKHLLLDFHVNLRIISTRKATDDKDVENSNQDINGERIQVRNRPRNMPLQRPVIIFHDEDGNREANDGVRRHQIPLRHLIAIMARERVIRHHAARARQEAGLPPAEPEQEREPLHDENNPDEEDSHIGIERGILTELDLNFRFIPERNTDDDDEQMQEDMNIFDMTHERGNDNDMVDTDNSEDSDIEFENEMHNRTDESEINNEEHNLQEHEPTIKLVQSRTTEGIFVNLRRETHENDGDTSAQSHTGITKEGKIPAIFTHKRQRTSTSHSVESAPLAKKVTRQLSAEGCIETSSSSANIMGRPSGKEQHEEAACNSNLLENVMTSSNSSSSEYGKSEERDENGEITSEQQAEKLNLFYQELLRRIENLPLTDQMRKFLKYEQDGENDSNY